MKEHEVGRWIYGFLVLLAVFAVGFFLGKNQAPHPVQVITMEQPVKEYPKTETPDTATGNFSAEKPSEVIFPDLNSASQEELEALPGIGEEIARRIVEYRNTWGRFVAKEQIMDVKGIGESKYAAIEQLITVEVQNENSGGG